LTEPYRYKVGYCIEPFPGDGLTREEIENHEKFAGWGGTDKFILCSILEVADGASSFQVITSDHRRQELPSAEVYKMVLLMARQLAIGGTLTPQMTTICWDMFNSNLIMMGLPQQNLGKVRAMFAEHEAKEPN